MRWRRTKGRSNPCPSPLSKKRRAITRVLFPKWRIQQPATAQDASGAALGSQAFKECRALLEDKMSIENDVPPDRSYAPTRGRN
jgi:hypothetical protein